MRPWTAAQQVTRLAQVRARSLTARATTAAVVAALCWAVSPATGNAERVDRGGTAGPQDGSTVEGTTRSGRRADVARPDRLPPRHEAAGGSVGRTTRFTAPEEPGDSTDPADSSSTDVLVGVGETNAAAVAAEQGFTVRVVARDGEWFPVTKDYREDRINFVTEDGIVVRAFVG